MKYNKIKEEFLKDKNQRKFNLEPDDAEIVWSWIKKTLDSELERERVYGTMDKVDMYVREFVNEVQKRQEEQSLREHSYISFAAPTVYEFMNWLEDKLKSLKSKKNEK